MPVVHVSWMNPKQSTDLYPDVLQEIRIQRRDVKPTGEYFFVATAEEANDLKTKLDKAIPKTSYRLLREDNSPTGEIVSEPRIAILNI
jgi:hypothetical protein